MQNTTKGSEVVLQAQQDQLDKIEWWIFNAALNRAKANPEVGLIDSIWDVYTLNGGAQTYSTELITRVVEKADILKEIFYAENERESE